MRKKIEQLCCYCVRPQGPERIDDGTFETRPIRIGEYILFYGRRKSYFPLHCLLGPDWFLNVLVFALIVVIDGGVLYAVSPLGWPVILIGGVGACILLSSYTALAFSDPGIVYKDNNPEPDIELQSIEARRITPEIYRNTPRVVQKIDCGHCKIKRPITSSQ